MFSHVDSARTALDLPEENFVFTEQFKSLLREYGLLEMRRTTPLPPGEVGERSEPGEGGLRLPSAAQQLDHRSVSIAHRWRLC